MGAASVDVFRMANSKWEKRQGTNKNEWKDKSYAQMQIQHTGVTSGASPAIKKVQMKKSRRKPNAPPQLHAGRADKSPAFNFPEAVSNKEP